MPGSLESAAALVFGAVIPTIVFLYAAYWSFAMRRAMVVQMYRNHALALGLLTILIAIEVSGFIPNSVANLGFIGLLVGFFAFVDSTIPVARRSDPLLRPILSWTRIRKAVWILFAAIIATWLLTDYSGFPPQAIVAVVLPFVIGVPAFLKGARRSGDSLFRMSLRWIGYAILFFGIGLALFFVDSSILASPYDFTTSYAAIPTGVFFAFAAYSFYRSARSLAPVSELESLDSKVAPTTAVPFKPVIGRLAESKTR